MKGALTIADYPDAMIEIACSKCPRRGRLARARLAAEHGAALPLPDLLARLAADCPRAGPLGNDRCGAHYPALART